MFSLLKNPTCFDAALIEASSEIIFWAAPENLCESWQDTWLVWGGSVGRD